MDDLWKKGKLSTQMRLMQETASLISYTDEIWVRNGKRLNQGLRHRKYSGMIYGHCLPLCIISPSSAVISRSIFEEVGLFDETLPVCVIGSAKADAGRQSATAPTITDRT